MGLGGYVGLEPISQIDSAGCDFKDFEDVWVF